MNIYYVTYGIYASRCTGSYLVLSGAAATATEKVQELDGDYVRVAAKQVCKAAKALTVDDARDVLETVIVEGCYACDLIDEEQMVRATNDEIVHLESGT